MQMKHGDKAKAKTAKASRKASVKKVTKPASSAKSKAPKTVKRAEKGAAATGKAAAPKRAASPADKSKADNSHGVTAAIDFSNAAVAAAFKRAVKKYPNAFRRLTD
jgi:hypothetical protein